MKKFKKFFTFVFSTVLAATSVLSTSSMAVTPADVEAKDPNGDGVITMADVAFMYQILSGKYNPSDLTRFDIDDNDVVSDVDAIYTQMYTAGMLSNSLSIPPGNYNSSIMAVAETSSTSRNYRVYNAQTGAYKRNYSLSVTDLSVSENTRDIIGDNDQYVDWSDVGVAKIMSSDSIYGYLGTGFVVGPHTIATAAHVVFETQNDDAYNLNGVTLFNNYGSPSSYTPVEIHVPLTYVQATERTNINDYALITIKEDLSDYMSFNLGFITNNAAINNLPITVVGFPGTSNGMTNNNPFHMKEAAEGNLINNSTGPYPNNMNIFAHNADTYEGNSGSPIYAYEIVNGEAYCTVVGIHITGFATHNIGLRFTPHNLKFYKSNPNIQY